MKVRRKGGASAPPADAPDEKGALAPETSRLQGLKAPNFTRPEAAGLKPRPSAVRPESVAKGRLRDVAGYEANEQGGK